MTTALLATRREPSNSSSLSAKRKGTFDFLYCSLRYKCIQGTSTYCTCTGGRKIVDVSAFSTWKFLRMKDRSLGTFFCIK